MNDVEEVGVELTAFGATPRAAIATIVTQAPGRRLTRALTALGMFWGMALVGLFIPVAHFILVPTFLAAGIAMAVVRGREDHRLLGVHGQCPRCGVDQRFAAGGRLSADMRLDCPHCHNSLGCTLKSP